MNFDWYLDPILRKYADFTGRASRQEYWMFFLYSIVIAIGIYIVAWVVGLLPIYWLYSLAVLIPGIAIGVRRLHDTNKSGWFILLGFIPFVGIIILIVLMAMPGDPGPNSYGPPQAGEPQPSFT